MCLCVQEQHLLLLNCKDSVFIQIRKQAEQLLIKEGKTKRKIRYYELPSVDINILHHLYSFFLTGIVIV